MMLSRSHSASTSARLWLESNTVRPSVFTSRQQSWNTASTQCDLPGVRAEQPQQQTDGRRLARAVRPEKSVDLASLDRQVETVESARRSERLYKTRNGDRLRHAAHHCTSPKRTTSQKWVRFMDAGRLAKSRSGS